MARRWWKASRNYWDPCATENIIGAVERWCLEHRVERLSELIGGLQTE